MANDVNTEANKAGDLASILKASNFTVPEGQGVVVGGSASGCNPPSPSVPNTNPQTPESPTR